MANCFEIRTQKHRSFGKTSLNMGTGAQMKSLLFTALFFLFSCASKNPVAGRYSGFYELALGGNVSCHFLMKKDRSAIPTVVCHDSEQAWAVPIQEFSGNVWLYPPMLTQSESLIAFLESKDAEK